MPSQLGRFKGRRKQEGKQAGERGAEQPQDSGHEPASAVGGISTDSATAIGTGSAAGRAETHGVQIRAPERGLPLHEPEDLSERPCRCPICADVPAPAAAAEGDLHTTDVGQEELAPTFAGVYPRGLARLAVAELSRAGAHVVRHMQEHCVVLFQPPESAEGPLELSVFELLFQVVGGDETLPPAPVIRDIAKSADAHARRHARLWRSRLRQFKRWRVTVHRDHMKTRYQGPQVVPVIGDAMAGIGAVSLALVCTAGPVVDLTDFEVQLVVYLSDGIDKLRAASDTNNRSKLGGDPELMLLGLLIDDAPCRLAKLGVEKGVVLSRADDTVALCVAQRGVDALSEAPPPSEDSPDRSGGAIRVLDPMCGVGTYLLAMQWVLAHRPCAGVRGVELLGVDSEEESLGYFRLNAGRSAGAWPVEVIQGSSKALPLRDASVDLIVVDPPWGQRHSSHYYVKKSFPTWAREWARVLKPGGVAIVVTICKRVFEDTVLPPLQKDGLLELEESVQFDNKGWMVCRLYVVRKPLTAAPRFAGDGLGPQEVAVGASCAS